MNPINSVLATGDWYRFHIQKSGVYYIPKSFLKSLGMNVDNIDPRKIQLYGNGGRMLPLKNSDSYLDDLTENAIQVIGENDGVFNDSDGVLFYGEGVDNWNEESQTNGNLYADKSYYYITISGDDGKRIPENSQPIEVSTLTVTDFDDSQFREVDNVNVGKVGRTWFGEDFDTNNVQDFTFSIPNIVSTTTISFSTHLAAKSISGCSFKIEANNQLLSTATIGEGNGSLPRDTYFSTTTIPASENLTIKLTFNNNGVPTANGYLDYINLKFKRQLSGYGKQFRFQNNATATNAVKEYQISNASGIGQVWDITDIHNVSKYTNNNQAVFSFKSNATNLRKYIAIAGNDLYSPQKESQSKVANQNLKGTIFKNAQGNLQDVDYLIITPSIFVNQAERLANFHRNYSLLNVKVVTLESIYPEFSSGKQDVAAIRNFIKYVYNNASVPEKKVKYVNMFGDASYDFKNKTANNTNFVPILHGINSYTINESSFATDDFFVYMDNNDGYTKNGATSDNLIGDMDIAVGRMIANSTQQADELVTKVIEYHDFKSYGNWRNNFVVIADDADTNGDRTLQIQMNNLANEIVSEKPFMNFKKILLDSYVQETSAGGKRYPQARKDLFNAFENGALVFNYLGHGGEDGLSQERIWEKSDGQNVTNQYKYPLFITITCDFSRFDNPSRPTGGEFTFWNPRGGAIAMLTTVREIGQFTGEQFNYDITNYVFSYDTNDYVSIAEALRLAKNDYNGGVKIVACLGDPALMLAMPKPQVKLTKVNDAPVTQQIDDFKALSLMKINGEVTDENGTFLSTYNGEVAVQIYDKEIVRTTLNNDSNNSILNFNVLGETIFRGNATVVNGYFEFSFVVPRDITIAVGNGKMSFYAKRNNILLDKTGHDTTIKIGGVNLNAPADNTPPTVKLYMNDKTFISGGITNESPIFLAFLEDENGINTASGIGHDIIAILDSDESNPIKLNDYYETELDNYKSGKLKYPFRNLALGLHTITFKAWDVYNNPISAEIQFIVVGDESVTLSNVLNYPNPFVNYTQFWFSHNKPFEPLDVQIQIFTITGKVIWTKNQVVTTDGFLSKDISWDGKDDFGDKIGKGVYIYKLTVKSTISNSKTEKFEKLVIL
jgi:Peptidase family C25